MKTLTILPIVLLFVNILFSQNINDGLLLYYPFTENANDSTDNHNDGIVHGATLTEDRFGNLNTAYKFDGIDDFIEIPDNYSYKVDFPVSISAWVKPGTIDTPIGIIRTNADSVRYYGAFMFIYTDGLARISYGNGELIGPASRLTKVGSTVLEKGKWYHIVGILKNSEELDLYVNGVNDGGFYTGIPSTMVYNDNPAQIGTHDNGITSPPVHANATIDEIRIYNRILIQSEIDLLYKGSSDTIAGFTADKTNGPVPLTVNFSDLSTNASTWQWDFNNDGIVDSYDQNPTYTYFEADSFDVSLTVTFNDFSRPVLKENYIITYQDSFPNLYSIQDVPADQGGWVKVHFTGSRFDSDSLIFPKTQLAEIYTIEIDDGTGWTAAASTAAYGKTYYSVLVHTTIDSTAESDGLINFRVIAAMQEGNYVSKVLSGYSVDNLAPDVPMGLKGTLNDQKIELTWYENYEDDFSYYTIFRSQDMSLLTPIAITTSPEYTDKDITVDQHYNYAVSATDYSSNESVLSDVISIVVTSVEENQGIPYRFYLDQNYPNPFNPNTSVRFGLPKSSDIKVIIYNDMGQPIITLLDKNLPAGHHQVSWDGRNQSGQKVTSGIYYFRLFSENFTKTLKMQLIK